MATVSIRRTGTIAMAAALALGASSLHATTLPPVDCVITPNVTVELSSPIPGALAEVLAQRSEYVEQGQVVARMYAGVEQATVALARERSNMQTEIALENVNLEYDARERSRQAALYNDNLVARKALDDAERNQALTNVKLQQSMDVVRLRALELQRAEALLAQKSIRSPISGVVSQRYKHAGEYVEDQAILQIAQLDTLAVEAIVPMELFHSIGAGMAANVYSELAPAKPLRATVSLVDRMGDASSGTFGVRLELPNEDMHIPAGVKCSVQFVSDPRTTVEVDRHDSADEGVPAVEPGATGQELPAPMQHAPLPFIAGFEVGVAAEYARVKQWWLQVRPAAPTAENDSAAFDAVAGARQLESACVEHCLPLVAQR